METNPMVVTFELNGFKFMGLNAGPMFKFNEAVSFVVNCDTQNEIDYYWDQFGREGQPGKCGWMIDKYGVSWQIVPSILGKLMSHPETAPKATYAFLQMSKFVIADLEAAVK